MFYRRDSEHHEADDAIRRRETVFRCLLGLLMAVVLAAVIKLASGPTPWGKSITQRVTEQAPQVESVKAFTSFSSWLKSDITNPKVLRPKDHAIIGLWYGSAFAAGAAVLLLLTARWWQPRGDIAADTGEVEDEADSENAGESGFAKLLSARPLFAIFTGLALVMGLWFRAPAMSHSLWNDEEYAMRRFANGDWEGKTFEPVTWQDTLFENRNGNNHLLHSLLSRVSLGVWKATHSGAEEGAFSEVALRMPSLIAGLLTIVLIAMLGWEFGVPWMGVGAAWILALHPWHIRYSAEAKGYSLCLFFACLALLGLIRALRHNHLRHWLLFALGEACFLLSFAGSLHLALAINLVAVLECLLRRHAERLRTLLAFNLLAAIPVLVWTLPTVPQMLGFLDHGYSNNLKVNDAWMRDLGSHLAAGTMYSNPDTPDHQGTSWELMRASHPDRTSVLGWAVLLLGVLGLASATLESTAGRLAVFAPVLAGCFALLQAMMKPNPNLTMYYIYLLIPLALACGLAAVRMRLFPAVLVMLLVGGFGFATQLPREVMSARDRQPIRATVEAIREKHAGAITGVFGVSDKQARSYDTQVTVLSKPEDVDALLARGQKENQPVFIYFAGLRESANRSPELLKRVAQSQDLVKYAEFKGHEAMFSYLIYAQPGVK